MDENLESDVNPDNVGILFGEYQRLVGDTRRSNSDKKDELLEKLNPFVYLTNEDYAQLAPDLPNVPPFNLGIKAPKDVLRSRLLLRYAKVERFDDEYVLVNVPDLRLMQFAEQDLYVQTYLIDYYALEETGYLRIMRDKIREQTNEYWKELDEKYMPFLVRKYFNARRMGEASPLIAPDLAELFADSRHPFNRFGEMDHPEEPFDNATESRNHLLNFMRRDGRVKTVPIEDAEINTTDELLGGKYNITELTVKDQEIKLQQILRHTEKDEVLLPARNGIGVATYSDLRRNAPHINRELLSVQADRELANMKSNANSRARNDYDGKDGLYYPNVYRYMKYEPVNISPTLIGDNDVSIPNVRILYSKLSQLPKKEELVLSKEFCDLALKDPELKYPREWMRYGLFFLYLEEVLAKNFATRESRFVFTLAQYQRLYEMAGIPNSWSNQAKKMKCFYLLPYVPSKVHFYSTSQYTHDVYPLPSQLTINQIKTEIERYSPIPWRMKVPSGRTIRTNLNGGKLAAIISNYSRDDQDIDLRLDYTPLAGRSDSNSPQREDLVSDSDFDYYIANFKRGLRNSTTEAIKIGTGIYRCKIGIYDIYRASFGAINNYHVAPVRVNFDGEELLFFPSAIMAHTTKICPDLRYFTTVNGNPMQVVEKYANRGWTFVLNDVELAQMYEYKLSLPFPEQRENLYNALGFTRLFSDRMFDYWKFSPFILREIASLSERGYAEIYEFVAEDAPLEGPDSPGLYRALRIANIYLDYTEHRIIRKRVAMTNNFMRPIKL